MPQVLQLSLIPVIFALFMTDFFDTMGTVIAVGQEAKLLDEEGRVPKAKRILLVDSLAAVGGRGRGRKLRYELHRERRRRGRGRTDGDDERGSRDTLPARAAVLAPDLGHRRLGPDPRARGGRDIFVSPVTAPALIVVGFLMMTAVRFIPWEELRRGDTRLPHHPDAAPDLQHLLRHRFRLHLLRAHKARPRQARRGPPPALRRGGSLRPRFLVPA